MQLYGPLLITISAVTLLGGSEPLVFANIFSYLAGAYAAGGAFAEYLDRVHSQCPSSYSSPWKCIVYADELHPGNQLASGARKTWAIYCSFAEFGKDLSKSNLWFTLLVKRSDQVAQLQASIGQCFRLILEHMFENKFAHPHAGVLLQRGNSRLKLYWTLGFFLQDGSAQKYTFSNKQDSGSRVCMACKNLFRMSSKDDDEGQKEISKFIKHSQLDIASDQEILDSWSRMQSRTSSCSKAQMKTWSQAAGIDWSDQALLVSPVLRKQGLLQPISQYMHDFMHGLASNGVLTWITFLLIQTLFDSGVKDIWKQLHGFVQLWVHPSKGKLPVHKLFDTKAVESHKKASKFKCSASEMLGVCEILAYYVDLCCIPKGLCMAACECFLAWCKVLTYCVAIPSLQHPDHRHLLFLVEQALASTIKAGWSKEFRPKMHWALHFSDALKLHGQLPGVWSLERKHKDIRKHANVLCNTSAYETSLLSSVIAEHIHSLETHVDSFKAGCFLENVRKPTKKLMNALQSSGLLLAGGTCMCSSSCRLASGATVTSGDVVYLRPESTSLFSAGQVHCFFQFTFGEVALVEKYIPGEKALSTLVSKWLVPTPRQLTLVPLEEFLCSVTYSNAKGKVTCLTPAFLLATR
eukprot:Skav233230  [mRNA]  locus=scaffold1215:329634:331538:- [translate_table: standard]